ncbi:pilus assembly protein [Vibrio aestuarianus]|uniref:TadE/TadG family type IV pilus assembly protein n=1 Tax=Vibrio aestuarianus TaxID=28171 RepID=UPI00237C63A5|nr:TadE family protein [Vibrio aestuarianus]MDE1314822.1 pilus assembly protein [Vibrio aestuarianus]MDE1330976.1 pilus assembly protein [Vibrio aestuarianus]
MIRRIQPIQGIAVIEFTLASSVLFVLLFSIISIGYLMFSLQAINDVTRKAARLAAVCQISQSQQIASSVAASSAIAGIDADSIEIEYLDQDGAVLASPTVQNVRFVRARVVNLTYQLLSLLEFLGESGLINIPSFETTIPSESLGIVPNGTNTNC